MTHQDRGYAELATEGRQLRELLAPMPVEEFLRDYWLKRSVVIRGHAAKFNGLFSKDELFEALKTAKPATSLDRDPIVRAESTVVVPDKAIHFFEGGLPICVTRVSMLSAKLARHAAALQWQLNFPGATWFSCYLSPEGRGYSTLHTDARAAITIQLAGRKRWRYAERPAVEWPRSQMRVGDDGKTVDRTGGHESWEEPATAELDVDSLREVVLEPGDVFYMSAGTWHGAQAESGESLSLNLSFVPISFFGMLDVMLRDRFGSSAAWRGVPPSVDEAEFRTGRVPARVGDYFASRLRELADLLAGLDPSGPELNRAWRTAIHGGVHAANAKPERPIEPTDRLQLREDLPITSLVDIDPEGEPRITLRRGAAELSFSQRGAVEFMQALLQARTFLAEDAVTWTPPSASGRYPWHHVKRTLELMMHHGMIGFATSPALHD